EASGPPFDRPADRWLCFSSPCGCAPSTRGRLFGDPTAGQNRIVPSSYPMASILPSGESVRPVTVHLFGFWIAPLISCLPKSQKIPLLSLTALASVLPSEAKARLPPGRPFPCPSSNCLSFPVCTSQTRTVPVSGVPAATV